MKNAGGVNKSPVYGTVTRNSCKNQSQGLFQSEAVDPGKKEKQDEKVTRGSKRNREEVHGHKENPKKNCRNQDQGEVGKGREGETKGSGKKREEEGGRGKDKDKDEEKEAHGEVENGKEDNDTEVDSVICNMSIPQSERGGGGEAGASSNCRSQDSDDMYHGLEGISSVDNSNLSNRELPTPMLSKSYVSDHKADVDIDTSTISSSVLPMSDGSTSQYMQHGSPSMQPGPLDACAQTSSDASKDLYGDGNLFTSRQPTPSSCESPSLHPVLDAKSWQMSSEISKDMHLGGNGSLDQQSAPDKGPPCNAKSADTGQQTSSNASKEESMPPSSPVTSGKFKLKIRFPSETVATEDSGSTVEDGSLCELLSRLKEVRDVPNTAKGLLSSGVLDGCRVYYHYRASGNMLTGVVKNGGILCDCKYCKGKVAVNVSSFEKHAGSNARHPSDYTFLENGSSLQDILKLVSQGQGKLMKTVQKPKEEETEKSVPRSLRGVPTHQRNGIPSTEDLRRADHTPKPSRGLQVTQSSQARDGSLHKLLFLPGGLPNGTEVAYYVKGQCYLKGTKQGQGICCGCCNDVVSCSQFEAHAGWASRRNAYISMFISNGQSLHEYALALAARNQSDKDGNSSKENDDFCAECGDGGDLVLCDVCPKAFHAECVGLSSVPTGDWFCPICEDQRQHPWKKNAKALGRVHRLWNKDESAGRCQRVVKASGNTIGGCVICRNGDFLKSGFGPKTIMLCDQCEREYHVGCMKEKGVADLQELPAGKWFCCDDCKHIHTVLERLVIGGSEPLKGHNYVNLLGKEQEGATTGLQTSSQPPEFTWQLLHGRRGDPQKGRMLSEAASIFTESFDPIVDDASGRDLIPLIVYSRSSIKDQDFQGMYCAVLKEKGEVVSAAVIRIFGRNFAEMPLVATASSRRGQGCFQMLMSCIEGLLGELRVKHLILPAAEGAEGIWTIKFGFLKLDDDRLQEFRSEVPMMIFQGSYMLIKAIS